MTLAQGTLRRKNIEAALRALFFDPKEARQSGQRGRTEHRRGHGHRHHGHAAWHEDDGGWAEPPEEVEPEAEHWGTEAEGGYWGQPEEDSDDPDNYDGLQGHFSDAEEEKAYGMALEELKQGTSLLKSGRRTMSQAKALLRDIKVGRGFDAVNGGKKGAGKSKGWPKGQRKGKGPRPPGPAQGHYGSGSSGPRRKGSSTSSGGKPSSKGSEVCLHCGRPGHWRRDCPALRAAGGKGSKSGHFAEYDSSYGYDQTGYLVMNIDFVDPELETADVGLAFPAFGHAGGTALLDTGATCSFGGARAVENFAEAYWAQNGCSGVSVDPTDRPVFLFGDGKAMKLVSRADLTSTSGRKSSFCQRTSWTPTPFHF